MSLKLASINVNGLQTKKKRHCVFEWLNKRKYDIVCLQETHCNLESVGKWKKEWKNINGGDSTWNCGSSDSRGVGILLNKNFKFTFVETHRDDQGRLINFDVYNDTVKLSIKCIYSPNDGESRKRFFESLVFSNNENCYNLVCGDFNCVLNKNSDRHPIRTSDDIGTSQVKSVMNSHNLCDAWRILNPDTRRYTFQRNNSKSRIDYMLVNNGLLSKMSNVNIVHFPFSDHDLLTSKIKLNEIERGPGVWVMNENIIKTDEFRNAFTAFWEIRKTEINKYSNLREWWDITKYKIKALCIEISSKLNINDKKLKDLENELEKRKKEIHTVNDSSIKNLEKTIKEIYEKKAEAARIRSKCKWYEEGEKSSKYFFQLEKSNGQDKLWSRIKCEDGSYKTDIDSILDEQLKFYENLFKTEGWDEEKGNWLLQFVNTVLDENDRHDLEKDIEFVEIENSVKLLKRQKSPGEDGIIAAFYQIYWDIIKDEFSDLINEIFCEGSLCKSQGKGMISLIFKGGERESIKNWRPLTVLNCDYKIIAKILALRLKKMLPKIIHSDQKGFVKGRNICEANRLIQDIIEYIDQENEEGVIIFLDQQKAFDRIEWGWVQACLRKFNFGPKFCHWVNMLLKDSKTCIKTNGYVSKYITISRSARQGCPIAPLLYIIQAEPMACAIRANENVEGIKLSVDGHIDEAKISMFADDTQLLNKNEKSVEKSFEILNIYELASGAKINFEKTRGLFIGKLKGRKPKFTKIKWIKTNVKTLGVYHGYDIDDNVIWKPKIDKIKSCLEIWKTRNLSFKGKVLIIKNLIISIIGYEIDMRGIPENYLKEINTLIWGFIWDNKVNQIERNVCCLDKDKGGMDMIDVYSFVKSRQIKHLYKIIHSKEETWNILGKKWLQSYDFEGGIEYFLCYCSDISSLKLNKIPKYYRNMLESLSSLRCKFQPCTIKETLDTQLFCNKDIRFGGKPLYFKSFLNSSITTIRDVWDLENKQFKNCNTIYNLLTDKRNCISEYSKIKAAIPTDYINILKGTQIPLTNLENNIKLKGLFFYSKSDNVVLPCKIKPKDIQKILNGSNVPKVQLKWENAYGNNLDWNIIWSNMKYFKIKNKIIEFQWKSIHNIIYTEFRLNKFGLSQVQGKCHFCKQFFETQTHLFYNCKKIYPLIEFIELLLIRSHIIVDDNIEEKNMILGFYEGNENELVIGNILISVAKWTIWKFRNKIKYENAKFPFNVIKTRFICELKDNIQLRLKTQSNVKPIIENHFKQLLEYCDSL